MKERTMVMERIDENRTDKEALQDAIDKTVKEMDEFDPSDYITEEQYDDMLDETSGPIQIGNLTYDASDVLKNVDPTAYRCGYNDFVDIESEDIHEFQELAARLEELEEELEDLENEEE